MSRLLIEPRPYSLIRAQNSRTPFLLPCAAFLLSLYLCNLLLQPPTTTMRNSTTTLCCHCATLTTVASRLWPCCTRRFHLSPSLPIPMSNNASRKRATTTVAPQPPPPKQALMTQEEDFVDEDVFIDQTLVPEDEESIILCDIEQCQALIVRLSKWMRPPLSDDYVAQSCSIGEYFP